MSGVFPLSALVGLETLKLALELSAIDPRLSLLIRGDKGAGKSTAARGLAELLAPGAPFVNLPIGATEDRLLGGLDIERTLKSDPVLKPGLVARAHGGVLYVDEVNLLADHLADALLDAAASGILVVEREGFSVSQPAEFVLLGSMNPEEGSLRPQLLDRFALVVDVETPMDPPTRAAVLERRLSYDADRTAFCAAWRDAQVRRAGRLAAARESVNGTIVPPAMLQFIAERTAEHGVRSLRADLAIVRAGRAYAALLDAAEVTADHVETVLPLALAHRMPPGRRPPKSAPPPPPPPGGWHLPRTGVSGRAAGRARLPAGVARRTAGGRRRGVRACGLGRCTWRNRRGPCRRITPHRRAARARRAGERRSRSGSGRRGGARRAGPP